MGPMRQNSVSISSGTRVHRQRGVAVSMSQSTLHESGDASDPRPKEVVRIWRQADHARLLFMHGLTTTYSFDPTSEYVIGVIARAPLVATRGRARHTLQPGDLAVWDPGRAHAGMAVDGQTWECRLVVVELGDLTDLACDPDRSVRDLEFPDPVVRDQALTTSFLRLHRAMEGQATALERDGTLASFLQELAARSPASSPERARRRAARDDVALRRACSYLADNLTSNIRLDELAQAAETSTFRLVRLFRAGLGAAPHVYQVAQRVKLARGLLERGVSPADAAVECGFFDQSHLHRHFRRMTGMSPGRYASAFAKDAGRPWPRA
jgi:AraC-like DNA-binding protein